MQFGEIRGEELGMGEHMRTLSVDTHVAGGQVSRELVEHVGALALIFVEMQQGHVPASGLDDVATPAARRRIRTLIARSMRAPGGFGLRTSVTTMHRTLASHPILGVVEGTCIIAWGGRVRALAVRLEQQGDRWVLTDIAPPDGGLPAAMTSGPVQTPRQDLSDAPDDAPPEAVAQA
jgi:hypothetical protein